MGFFVEAETVWVEFTGQFIGWRVALKKEMNAGDQEELEDAMLRMEVDGSETPRPLMRQGGQKLLELNVLKIVSPEGQEIAPTPEKLRQLHRAIRAKLLQKIRELNSPLAELAEITKA